MRSTELLLAALLGACGGGAAATHEGTTNTGESAASGSETAEDTTPSGTSSCDAYLARYRRCESVLQPEIMAGERRPVSGEEGWIRYVESTDRASAPGVCEELERDLPPSCP